jgi:hypothetical protein
MKEIGGAWGVKDRLRMLLKERERPKRVACGYRSMENYQRRILSHIAVTRPQRAAA